MMLARIGTLLLCAVTAFTLQSVPAQANIDVSSTEGATKASSSQVDAACVEYEKTHPKMTVSCEMTTTAEVGAVDNTNTTTASMVYDAAVADGSSQLMAAYSAATAHCRTWRQYKGGGFPGVWMEQHIGKYCYTGSGRQVWVWSYPGRTKHGYHYCHQGIELAYTVVIDHCNLVRQPYRGTYFRQNWDRFRTKPWLGGIRISYAHDMHVNVWPSGRLVSHNGRT